MPKKSVQEPSDKLLPKLTLFFFSKRWMTAAIWLVLVVFGALCYTTLLKREGFPSINIPLVIVTGSSAQTGEEIDSTIAKPLSDVALKQEGASTVQTTSQDNFFQAMVQYDESVKPEDAKKDLENKLKSSGQLPQGVELSFSAPYFGVTGGSTKKVDATISLYDRTRVKQTEKLVEQAETAVKYLNTQRGNQIENFFVQSPYDTYTDPASGESVEVQRSFDRYAVRQDNQNSAYNSVIIGVTGVENSDVIELDAQVQMALDQLSKQPGFEQTRTAISASFAPSIKENISELQRVLLEGLIAVLIIGSIVIAIRASLITVISMVTVILTTIGLLYLIGYSLNVITLFALILGLSLIVDDTIIMTEAIDAARRKHTDPRAAVREASRKISRAMVAATLTAAFSFAPLLFVSGILGSFIRAIPATIISALLISLLVALIFIPFFARFFLLGKKQMGSKGHVVELAASFEHRLAQVIGKPMLWSKGSRGKQFFTGFTALFISLIFIVAAGFLFTKVTFNIFPASKDSNQIAVGITYPAGVSMPEAQVVADSVDRQVLQTLGSNLDKASYYGMASNQTATLNIDLIPYDKREQTAPQLVDQINNNIKVASGVQVKAYQVDVGPPSSSFTVNVQAEDREAATKLANDIATFLKTTELTRPSGEVAHFTDVTVANTDIYTRVDGDPVLGVTAGFDGTDTTTLTTLAQDAVKKEFDADKLAEYGLPADALNYDIGQESENQDSFKSLALAFPIVLLAVFILLAVQFRSLLQPLLIFMAIPFSLFGVAFGLYITNNPISFFSLLGFFALIGLSIKNTILLTDYANQARRSGMGAIDSAVAAIAERFRPLIATSLTAIVSLLPLALSSPFWEGLAYVLIFGLASSTILVILVFPYYYLAGEYARMQSRRVTRKVFRRKK